MPAEAGVIELIRRQLGLTQDQMAGNLGLNSESRRARVSEWEAGKAEPKREFLIKYADLAKIEIKTLIDDREKISFE